MQAHRPARGITYRPHQTYRFHHNKKAAPHKYSMNILRRGLLELYRDEWIRTTGLIVPNDARYQLRYIPYFL